MKCCIENCKDEATWGFWKKARDLSGNLTGLSESMYVCDLHVYIAEEIVKKDNHDKENHQE